MRSRALTCSSARMQRYVDSAREIASPGLFYDGVNFAALDDFLPTVVGQICPCPSDASLALDDPACVLETETASPAPAVVPEEDAEIPDMADGEREVEVVSPAPVDVAATPGAYGTAGAYGSGAYGAYGS